MSLKRGAAAFLCAGAFGAALIAGSTQAQIAEVQPAEFPPASYQGKQYVDSNGCVFVRAGIDGDVAWVPRVSRDRQLICGFRPSLAPAVVSAEPVVEPAPPPPPRTAAPVIAPAPAPRPARVAAAPAPRAPAAPVVVRQTAPKVGSRPVTAAPNEVILVHRSMDCAAGAQVSVRGDHEGCGRILPVRIVRPNGAVVERVVTENNNKPVPATDANTAAFSQVAQTVTARTRVAPKHVVENRFNTRNVRVPHGYRPVWDDDRLNPYRAEQNLGGRADMLLIWTQTVPRRLIDRRTGRDVTSKVPLVYPYTSVAQQRSELGEVALVTRNGQLMKRIVRKKPARKPVISTRSAPRPAEAGTTAKAEPKAPVGKRYVQVGSYGKADNAQRAAQNIARMGLRARITKVRRGGRTLLNVQAGPFAEPRTLRAAMTQLTQAGYTDAFYR